MRILFLVRQLTIGGCQKNACELALLMRKYKDVDDLFILSDNGELKKQLYAKSFENIILYPIVKTKFPSIRFSRFLHRVVIDNHITHIIVFDPVLSLSVFTYSLICDNIQVISYITAQATPQFYFPHSWKVCFVNLDTLNRYLSKFKIDERNVFLLRERINLQTFKNKLRVLDRIKVVAFITRFHENKRSSIDLFFAYIDYYIKNVDENIRIVICGDGELLNYYKEKYAIIFKRIEFRGFVSNINNVMQDADLVFGMASTIQQSICCGTPSVVVGDNGFCDLVDNENIKKLDEMHFNIHSVYVSDFKELSNKIIDVDKNVLVSNYLKFASENYDIHKGIDRILSSFTKPSYTLSKSIQVLHAWSSFIYIMYLRPRFSKIFNCKLLIILSIYYAV